MMLQILFIFLIIPAKHTVAYQKNRLNDAVLGSTQNMLRWNQSQVHAHNYGLRIWND